MSKRSIKSQYRRNLKKAFDKKLEELNKIQNPDFKMKNIRTIVEKRYEKFQTLETAEELKAFQDKYLKSLLKSLY